MPDIVIIGGGIAGLFAALRLAPRKVSVLIAGELARGGSSPWAQGGMAAAVDITDTPERHAEDTLAAAAGLADPLAVKVLTEEAPARVANLLAVGVQFDRDEEGRLLLNREGAHRCRRVLGHRGDQAGQEIMRALVAAVRRTPTITVHENMLAVDLVTRGGRVVGVRALKREGGSYGPVTFAAGATILATGGIGGLYPVTTNPLAAVGQGIGLAARAGAALVDCEFMQFHPTAMDIGRDPAPLATEALRGEGAILVNERGERFMTSAHPLAELAPRDIVTRAIFAERAAGHRVFLDATKAVGADFPTHFPKVFESAMTAEIDPRVEPIPVAPAAHYHMGGVATDLTGRTTVPGLWAIGEVASTGVHGANRLASNSLAEAVVFGERAARDIEHMTMPALVALKDEKIAPPPPLSTLTGLRSIMGLYASVIRDENGLARALEAITDMRAGALGRTSIVRDALIAAQAVVYAALARRESRGGHFRSDYPNADAAQAKRSPFTLAEMEGALGAGPSKPMMRTAP
jgi:L-aspartate oxidase